MRVAALLIHDTGPGTFIAMELTNLAEAKPSGSPSATVGFWDDDQVPVFFDLFLDASGAFVEVDMWKGNGASVIRWPVDRKEVLNGSLLFMPPARG